MNENQKLKKGVAYHGNRIIKHIHEDMEDIIEHGFNLVVHMFSHNDWDRHRLVMKDIIGISEDIGLEVWVDNWGLGGPPGDKSHFLSYYPDSHQIYSNGETDPTRVCLNSPDFRRFTKQWIDAVEEAGGKKIFWDEPHLAAKETESGKPMVWACRCNRCKDLFRIKYGSPMPAELTPEVEQFRLSSIVDYFRDVTVYSSDRGMENIICVMLGSEHGINLSTIEEIGKLKTLDNIGSDPYWYDDGNRDPYDFVYKATKKNLAVSEKFGKGHNIWIQGYDVPKGREEEIILATDAAYDAGARTILVWGFRGCESNDYRAKNPDLTWKAAGDAMRRISDRDMDARREFCRTAVERG